MCTYIIVKASYSIGIVQPCMSQELMSAYLWYSVGFAFRKPRAN